MKAPASDYAQMHAWLRNHDPRPRSCEWKGDLYLPPCERGVQFALRHDATVLTDWQGKRWSDDPGDYVLLCWGHHQEYDSFVRVVRRRRPL